MSIYILQVQLFGSCPISWLPTTSQFSGKTWIHMVEEVIYVFYSYVSGLYVVSLKSMTAEHNYGCHQKDSLCLFYYVQIHISQIYTFWNEIKGYHLTWLVWHTRIIFRFFLYVDIFHLLQRREDVGICWNQLQIGFHW